MGAIWENGPTRILVKNRSPMSCAEARSKPCFHVIERKTVAGVLAMSGLPAFNLGFFGGGDRGFIESKSMANQQLALGSGERG